MTNSKFNLWRALCASAWFTRLSNIFPSPETGTGWLKAFRCRWFHVGSRSSSGMPAAGRLLHHAVCCLKCGARYEIVQPNTPQYAHTMPFQKPDKSAARSWDEHRRRKNRPVSAEVRDS